MGFNSGFKGLKGRDSSVGIATRYGPEGSGIESRWAAKFSELVQTVPGAHPASCAKGTGSFLGVKRPGSGDDQPAHLAPRLKEEQSYLYLYFPSGTSQPVIG